MDTIKLTKGKIKEFQVARTFALICMVAVHTEFAIYNYNNASFGTLFDYLGSPFAAPIFMFILGANIILSRHSSPKKLFVRGISVFIISIIFNIICHALPFFIIDYKLGSAGTVENSLHWIFAVDILTFAGLAFIFFSVVKHFKLKNRTVIIIGLLCNILNTILINNFQFSFDKHPIISAITSIFYGSSITGYFSFLGWIIFPIAGYIFIQVLLKVKESDKNRFYGVLGVISTIVYLIMVFGTFTVFKDWPLVVYAEEYSYYAMPLYDAIGTIIFCLGWISIMYFVSKIIPKCFNNTIERFNKNLTNIYIIQWFIINYTLVLPFNGNLKVGEIKFILIFIIVIIVSDLLAYIYSMYVTWKNNIINSNN